MAQIIIKNIKTGAEEIESFTLTAHACGLCKKDVFALKVNGEYIAQAQADESGCASLVLPDFDYREFYMSALAWLYANGYVTDADIDNCGAYESAQGFTARAMGKLYRGACAVRHMGVACAPGICEHQLWPCDGWTFVPTDNGFFVPAVVVYYKWTGAGCELQEAEVRDVYEYLIFRDLYGRIFTALLPDFTPGYLCIIRSGREYCNPTPVWSGTVVYYVL